MEEDQIGTFILHWSHKNHRERDDAHKQVTEVLDVPPYEDETIDGVKVQTRDGDIKYINLGQIIDVGVPADYHPED